MYFRSLCTCHVSLLTIHKTHLSATRLHRRTPSLETPAYTILKRTAGYQIRRYEPFLVAQAPLDVAAAIARNAGGSTAASTSGAAVTDGAAASISAASGRPQFDPAGPGMNAFNALAGRFARSYLYGTIDSTLGNSARLLLHQYGAGPCWRRQAPRPTCSVMIPAVLRQ